MPIYFLVRNSDNVILLRRNVPDDFDPTLLSHKFGPSFESRLCLEVVADAPPFDAATQTLVKSAPIFTDTEVQYTWDVVNTPIPSVLRWQLKQELNNRSLLESVNTWLQSLTAAQRRAAHIHWQDKPSIARDSQFTEALRVGLGLTSVQMDDVFRKAALLT